MINVYTIMMAIIVFLALFTKGNKQGSKAFIIISCLLMFVVLGFRDCYTVGNDSSSSYLHVFQKMPDMDWKDLGSTKKIDESGDVRNTNIAFYYLMKIMYYATNGNYQIYIAFISVIVIISIAYIVYKYSVSPIQSFVYYWGLLLYPMMFNVLKQSIAMSILLFAFDAIVNKRFIKFIILTAIAALFHFPALIFLPAYFLYQFKLGRAYLSVLVIFLIITYFFRDRIVKIMLRYYSTDLSKMNTDMRFLANKVLIMLVIVLVAIVLRPPTEEDKGNIYNGLLTFMGISILLQTFASYNNTFERLSDYYFQFSILFIPLVFEKIELKKNYLPPELNYTIKTISPLIFCAFGIWRFSNTVKDPSLLFLPYSFGFTNIS